MKIYVGTANWGKPYGINNKKLDHETISDILNAADKYDCGIETAWDYDCMDELEGMGDQFEIIFKGDRSIHFEAARSVLGCTVEMKHHSPYSPKYHDRSIYSVDDMYSDGVIEFPYNVVDQRFSEHLWGRFHIARSVFIQGLAFSMPDFHGIPFYHLCWNFVRNNPNIDGIVVGVDSAEQLEDIMNIPQYEIDYSKIGKEGWFKCL